MGYCFRDFRKPNNVGEEGKLLKNATSKKCSKDIDMYPPRSLYRIVCEIQCFLEESNGPYAVRKMDKNEYSW